MLVESLKEVPITRGTFPAKLFEYMAAGRPIVFGSREGEAIRELNSAGGALSFGPDEPERLSDLIMKLKSRQIDGDQLGNKYREHAVQFHRREVWAARYQSLLDDLLQSK